MRLEVRRLREFLVAPVEGTHVRPVARVYPHVRSERKKHNCKIMQLDRSHPFYDNKCQITKVLKYLIFFSPSSHLKLKSNENLFPQPSNVHWNGFSPVCTSWCRFSFELSTNALPHSAHTCTRGPCVCRCLRIAELSRNILLQPLCGHAIVLS